MILLVEDLSQQRLPARTLAAVLQRAGLRVQLVDFKSRPSPNDIIALAQREHPRLIVFSILFADRVPEHLALVTALRRAGIRAHITLIGPLPTFASTELPAACPALDSVLCGEAEASIVQLASIVCRADFPLPLASTPRHGGDRGEAWQTPIPGPSPVADGGRESAFPPPRSGGGLGWGPDPLNLDDLPFPLHDDLPEYAGYGFATVESSRGCYHACTFCLPCAFYRAMGTPYRLRSIPGLVDEIESLHRRGTRLFLFDDEQFLPPGRAREKRIAELASQLERRKLDIAFTIKCRADDVDEKLFRRLKDMGLLRVYVGVESGCQDTLDLLGKGVTVQSNAEALATLNALGIVADFRSLLFHPWSTLEAVRADLDFLQSVTPDVPTLFHFQEVQVYPGTPLASRLQAEGRRAGDPWLVLYTIADPRAEILRRLMRIVFSSAHVRFQGRITQTWFDLLLQRRFQPAQFDADRANQLRAEVLRINRASLDVWRDMLAFADAGDIYDAEQVNARAADWAARINQILASPHASCYPCVTQLVYPLKGNKP